MRCNLSFHTRINWTEFRIDVKIFNTLKMFSKVRCDNATDLINGLLGHERYNQILSFLSSLSFLVLPELWRKCAEYLEFAMCNR